MAAVALLLLGCTFGYFARWREWNWRRIDDSYQQAFNDANRTNEAVKAAQDEFSAASQNYESVHQIGNSLGDIGQRRIVWAELLKAVNECLPKDEKPDDDISKRNIIYVDAIDCERKADVNEWKTAAQQLVPADEKAATPEGGAAPGAEGAAAPPAGETAAATPAPAEAAPATAAAGPASNNLLVGSGNAGWIVMIKGHHYHNSEKDQNSGAEYVRGTILKALKDKDDIQLTDVDDKGRPVLVSTKDIGIEMPVMLGSSTRWNTVTVADPNAVGGAQPAQGGGPPGFGQDAAPAANPGAAAERKSQQTVGEYPFVVEFIWKPTTLTERERIRRDREQKKAAEAEQAKMATSAEKQ